MQEKIAVDIVILPPKEMNDLALLINKSLDQKESGIVFQNNICFPHISLLMGTLLVSQRKEVEHIIQGQAEKLLPLDLEISKLKIETISNGERVSGFEVSSTSKLEKLHWNLVNQTENLLGKDATATMFFGQPIREGSVEYTRNFREKSSFKNFHPHITLGIGEAKSDMKFPIPFTANRIALCHLGNYNTCRKILFETSIKA